jgi:hypothetical protein
MVQKNIVELSDVIRNLEKLEDISLFLKYFII